MPKSRHVFACKDGQPLPEWGKLPGRIECVRYGELEPALHEDADILWVRLPADGGEFGRCLDQIKGVALRARIVAMADIPDDENALAVFAAGARGYCNSHSNGRTLKLIARVVGDGGLWIGESLMRRLVHGVGVAIEQRQSQRRADEIATCLTGREREVAETIAGGASNKEVARLLQISERTVKAHLSTIFNKLGVRDRLQLTIKIKMLR